MDSLYNVQGYDRILVRILYMHYAICLPSELGRIGDYQHIRHRIYQSTLFLQDNVLSFDERNVMAFVGHLILLQLSKGGLWAESAGEEGCCISLFWVLLNFFCCRLLSVDGRVMDLVV
jgi:hypothetical protein